MLTLRDLPIGGLRLDLSAWAENLGKPQAVRGVDLAQLGVATLIYDQPRRFGVTFSLPR